MKKFRRDRRGRFIKQRRKGRHAKRKAVKRRRLRIKRRLAKNRKRGLSKRVRARVSRARKIVKRRVVRPRRTRVRIHRRVRARPIVHREAAKRKWVRVERWIDSLERRYGQIDLSRSDPPSSRLTWVYFPLRFLWHERRWPPMASSVRYIILENWYVVYDENEDAYYLWVQRRMLGTGVSLEEVSRLMPKIIRQQKEKLNVNSYVEVRAHVGWTVYPLAEWARVRLGKKKRKRRVR